MTLNLKHGILAFLLVSILVVGLGVEVEIVHATSPSFKVSLREHKVYAAYDPVYTFDKGDATTIRMSTSTASLGRGYMFFSVNSAWLNGRYIRFYWSASCTAAHDSVVSIYDGEYIRSSTTDFPSGSSLKIKGKGLLQTVKSHAGTFAAEVVDVLINVSAGNQSVCTIFFALGDAWDSQSALQSVDWIELNTGGAGVGNLYTQHMTDSVTMEVTGSTADYGYIGTGNIAAAFITAYNTSHGVFYRDGALVTNGSTALVLTSTTSLQALAASNCSFLKWVVNATVQTDNPYLMTISYNTTVWCYFGVMPSLSGTAISSDVMSGKTFYNNSTSSIRTGTLTLTGNATVMDVLWGQTFYNNGTTLRYGEYVPMPPFGFADGNATEPYVFLGYCFYNNSTAPRYGSYVPPAGGTGVNAFPVGLLMGFGCALPIGVGLSIMLLRRRRDGYGY